MAKNATATVAVRAPRPKTPAQLAKKERNERLAAERYERLQARQRLVNRLKKLGYTGTEDQIIESFNRAEKEREADEYVKGVLAVPVAGDVVRRWLKARITMSSVHLAELIRKFLDRDGSVEGQKDNSQLKATIIAALNKQEKIAA
jgi:tRNA A37 methylthiotransferase MiaB